MALPIPVLVLGLLMMHLGPGLMLYAGSPTERVGLAQLWFFALLIWGSIAAMGVTALVQRVNDRRRRARYDGMRECR